MRIRRTGAAGSRLAAVIFLLGASYACLPLGRGEPSGWDEADRRGDSFVLRVDNQNYHEARLYEHWNGYRQRIGNVGGNRSDMFTLRWRTGDFRVEVDFVAAGGFISDAVGVSPGDTLLFRIPPGAR